MKSAVARILLGVIPACLMTLGGLFFIPALVTTTQKVLVAMSVVGTAGLIASFANYRRGMAPLILCTLLIGIIAMLVGGGGGAVSAVAIDVANHRLSWKGAVFRIVSQAWLVLGPITVGIIQAVSSVRKMRAPVSSSAT